MTNLNPIVWLPDPNAIGSYCGATLDSIKSCGNARSNSIGSGNLARPNILWSGNRARSSNFEYSCGAESNNIGFEIVVQNIFLRVFFTWK